MHESSELKYLYARLDDNYMSTKADFAQEVCASERLIEYMRTILDGWDMDAPTLDSRPDLQTSVILFARNRQLFLSAYDLFMSGCYGSSLCLLRIMLENTNLMRLFQTNPKEAVSWTNGHLFDAHPTVKAAHESKPKLGEKYYKLHAQLSNYVHPHTAGWNELFVPSSKGSGIQNMPTYRKAIAQEVWGILLLLGLRTVTEFVGVFKSNMAMIKAIDGLGVDKEVSKILRKYSQ